MRLLYAGVIAMLTSGAVRGQENLEILKPAGGKPVGNVASYAIGYNVGVSLAGEQLLSSDLNKEDFLRGVLDALDRKDMVPNRAELEKAMEEFSQKMQAADRNATKNLGWPINSWKPIKEGEFKSHSRDFSTSDQVR